MGNCDLCSTWIDANARRYSASQMREAVRAGLRPDSTGPMAAMALLVGDSMEEVHAGWVQQVMTDHTDWAMCPTCTTRVEDYLAKGSKQWWQVWK